MCKRFGSVRMERDREMEETDIYFAHSYRDVLREFGVRRESGLGVRHKLHRRRSGILVDGIGVLGEEVGDCG